MTSRSKKPAELQRRQFLAGVGGAALVAPLSGCMMPAGSGDNRAADRILLGNVRTLDAQGTMAQALAIADGKVLAVGSRDDVMKVRGSATHVHDLAGATIIPGFNDAHAHLEREGLKTIRPSLAGIRSIPELLDRVAALTRSTPAGTWIVTMPVGEPPFYFGGPAILAEKRMPTRQEIDRVAPNHPVCIGAPFGYWGAPPTYTALNSAALKLNRIDRTTVPRVENVEIVHDQSGEPTGIIISRTVYPAMDFDLLPAVPRFTFEDRLEGLRRSLPLYHAKGTTSVYEGHGETAQQISVYRRLWEQGGLTMRVGLCVSPSWGSLAEADRAMRDWLAAARGSGFGNPMLRISGIFVGYGGDAKVAALARERLPDSGWSGQVEQANTPADFEAICMLAGKYDIRLHTLVSDNLHEVVPILTRVAQTYPIGERRWVIEHIGRSRIEDLRALKALGVTTTLIPTSFLWKGGIRYLNLDPAEANLLSPARQLIELGVPVAAGTDNIPYDPLFSLWAMVARQERTTGRVLGPDGRISNEQALRLMTVAGARLTFDENVKGPLLPGRYADLAVLSGDPVTTSADDLRGLTCTATLVGGRVVHGAV